MEKTELEQLEGTVSAVVFQNQENGYSVLRLKAGRGEAVTVVGVLPGVCTGMHLLLEGSWQSHPSYGRQFRAERGEQQLPTETDAILAYLSAGVIKGIGPKLAQTLTSTFGARTFEVLESQPEKLAEIKGLSLKKARAIQSEFLQKAGMRTLLEFLSQHSLPAGLALPLWHDYGPKAIEMVQGDPYLLVDPEWGVRFADADRLAAQLGIRADDPQRVEAGILYTLTHNLDVGHVFLPRDKLLPVAARLLRSSEGTPSLETMEEALEALQLRGEIVIDEIAGLTAVYRADLYEDECYIALRLKEMLGRELLPPANIEELIDQVEQRQHLTYAPQQREAVRLAARSQVMLLTGGPGTGKTTSLRGILGLFEATGVKTDLAAPTGRAAKRLSDLCGVEATTIHRLLGAGYDPASGQLAFSKDEDDPLEAEAVIVDEMSMVDIPLMASLLRALKGGCRLVLVGDPDQLPSVGPGQLFDHLIRSGKIPLVRLTEIFRQARESAIVMNAHAVDQGECPDLHNRGKDFFFLRRPDPEQAVETIVDLCVRRLPQNMGIPADQIQVLSPTRKYIAGTANLNTALQAALNPPGADKREKQYGGFTFREGDRVMQIRNNYDILWREHRGGKGGMGIFNGDIGVIESIDSRTELMTINFEGRVAEYTSDMLSELEPAYAMTVHKAQGSEYRAVILAAVNGAPKLLTRGVLYTAITRAKDLLIIVGEEGVIAKMVANDRQTRRYSGLRARLMAEDA
ncbi:MAG: ATP-dependent RecD-like DNA helicase [Clostridiales bacterium]|nr:ATP-dependent RecD-like DNA helicase [Clostridiales bacterium]